MDEEAFRAHPHRPLLVKAYARFLEGIPRAALYLLEPVLVADETARSPAVVTSLLWGLAGDCYFKLDEAEAGFAAYRVSISLDPKAGCLVLYARQVARHCRSEEAEFALRCADTARRTDKEALRRYPVHFLRHALKPDALYFRLVVMPLTRRRLRLLAASRRPSGADEPREVS